jgi:DNA repair protein RecN (Recombination protein N)
VDENTQPLMEQLEQIQELSDDFIASLKDYVDSLSFEPSFADEVNKKCDVYDDLLRKYGPTFDVMKSFYTTARKQYDMLANFEHNDVELRERLKQAETELKRSARKITKERGRTAALLKKTIESELVELGIKHVEFEVRMESKDFDSEGQDRVVFYISPNAGEGLKPLAQIVSSGEAARVMLALKKALTKVDPVPVLIFDEIDAQIGGRLGSVIGKKLKEISRDRQIILITHLPQIASFGDKHFKVTKSVESGRTMTHIEELKKDARVQELAKMMSGERKSEISLHHAQDMLVQASRD